MALTLLKQPVSPSCAELCAVVVTYYPDRINLQNLLHALAMQCQSIVVIDNTNAMVPCDWLQDWSRSASNRHFLPQFTNLGIGAAQNLGIVRARELGASHVLLCDQDSLPAPDMVNQLLAAADVYSGSKPLALLAPVFVPVASLEQGAEAGASAADGHFLKQHAGSYRRVSCPSGTVLEVDVAIASGSLIPLQIFNSIGLLDETLFIDAVDTEWCLRARTQGFVVLAVGTARLGHRLGDASRRIWLPGGWRSVPIHSPSRSYTIARNNIRICHYPHVPMAWRRYARAMLLRRLGFFLLLGPERWGHLKAIWTGWREGAWLHK